MRKERKTTDCFLPLLLTPCSLLRSFLAVEAPPRSLKSPNPIVDHPPRTFSRGRCLFRAPVCSVRRRRGGSHSVSSSWRWLRPDTSRGTMPNSVPAKRRHRRAHHALSRRVPRATRRRLGDGGIHDPCMMHNPFPALVSPDPSIPVTPRPPRRAREDRRLSRDVFGRVVARDAEGARRRLRRPFIAPLNHTLRPGTAF